MEQLLQRPDILFLILAWTAPWKAISLWKAARNNQLGWFIALFFINTLAILEIVYIFYFSKRSGEKQDSYFSKRNEKNKVL